LAKQPIIITGGGIGGLAASVGLARIGVATVVLEQSSQFGEIGAGIQIAPNAFHCFDALGIGDQARAGAVFIDSLRLMDALSGDEITAIPLDAQFRARFKNPYAVVHRVDLHGALLAFCVHSDLVDLRTSQRVTRYDQDSDGVRAITDDGHVIKGHALIGADGLHSAVRAQLVGDGDPVISGHTTYRSVIPADKMPADLRWNAATLWAGPKCHIVHYPLKGGRLFNLVVTYHRDVKEAIVAKPVSKAEVAQGFEHIAPRARKIIEHGENWKLWVLCDREPIANWIDGRVALLGDAAHPMLQYFAQGAAMALEDGVCLARNIEAHDDIPAAFAAFQAARVTRTARVQMNSRLIGEYIYHPAGPEAAVRNAIMQDMSPQDWYDRLEWLYGSMGF